MQNYSMNLPNDVLATYTLSFTDEIGRPANPPANAVATTDNPAVATLTIGADGKSITATPVGDGNCNLTYKGGQVVLVLATTVADPSAAAVVLGDPVFTALPAAAPADGSQPAQPDAPTA